MPLNDVNIDELLDFEFDLTGFSERLSVAFDGKTIQEIHEESGVPKSSIQKYLTAKTEPKISAFMALASAAGCDWKWLAAGGNSLQTDQSSEYVNIPYVPEKYIGTAQFEFHSNATSNCQNIKYRSKWLNNYLNVSSDSLYCFCVEGDRMEPTLRNMNMVLVQRTPHSQIAADGLYLLYYANKLAIRRVESRAVRVFLISDNQNKYGSFDVPQDNVVDIDVALEDSTKYGIFGRIVYLTHRI